MLSSITFLIAYSISVARSKWQDLVARALACGHMLLGLKPDYLVHGHLITVRSNSPSRSFEEFESHDVTPVQ